MLVYLTGKEHFQGMNSVYRRYFAKPYPNRATVIVAVTWFRVRSSKSLPMRI